MLPHRLSLAFAASLLLHAAVLGSGFSRDEGRRASPPSLQARLRHAPPASPPAEPLLKNTLDDETPPDRPGTLSRPDAQSPPAAQAATLRKRQMLAAQKKLAEHLYYPPEAIGRGLEGEVRLILSLAADGSIIDVQLGASSGHRLLDDAAIRAGFAIGSLPGTGMRELILPVFFRLH